MVQKDYNINDVVLLHGDYIPYDIESFLNKKNRVAIIIEKQTHVRGKGKKSVTLYKVYVQNFNRPIWIPAETIKESIYLPT